MDPERPIPSRSDVRRSLHGSISIDDQGSGDGERTVIAVQTPGPILSMIVRRRRPDGQRSGDDPTQPGRRTGCRSRSGEVIRSGNRPPVITITRSDMARRRQPCAIRSGNRSPVIHDPDVADQAMILRRSATDPGRILLMIRRDQTTGRQAATGQESRIRRRHAVELNAGDHVRDQIRAIV